MSKTVEKRVNFYKKNNNNEYIESYLDFIDIGDHYSVTLPLPEGLKKLVDGNYEVTFILNAMLQAERVTYLEREQEIGTFHSGLIMVKDGKMKGFMKYVTGLDIQGEDLVSIFNKNVNPNLIPENVFSEFEEIIRLISVYSKREYQGITSATKKGLDGIQNIEN